MTIQEWIKEVNGLLTEFKNEIYDPSKEAHPDDKESDEWWEDFNDYISHEQ